MSNQTINTMKALKLIILGSMIAMQSIAQHSSLDKVSYFSDFRSIESFTLHYPESSPDHPCIVANIPNNGYQEIVFKEMDPDYLDIQNLIFSLEPGRDFVAVDFCSLGDTIIVVGHVYSIGNYDKSAFVMTFSKSNTGSYPIRFKVFDEIEHLNSVTVDENGMITTCGSSNTVPSSSSGPILMQLDWSLNINWIQLFETLPDISDFTKVLYYRQDPDPDNQRYVVGGYIEEPYNLPCSTNNLYAKMIFKIFDGNGNEIVTRVLGRAGGAGLLADHNYIISIDYQVDMDRLIFVCLSRQTNGCIINGPSTLPFNVYSDILVFDFVNESNINFSWKIDFQNPDYSISTPTYYQSISDEMARDISAMRPWSGGGANPDKNYIVGSVVSSETDLPLPYSRGFYVELNNDLMPITAKLLMSRTPIPNGDNEYITRVHFRENDLLAAGYTKVPSAIPTNYPNNLWLHNYKTEEGVDDHCAENVEYNHDSYPLEGFDIPDVHSFKVQTYTPAIYCTGIYMEEELTCYTDLADKASSLNLGSGVDLGNIQVHPNPIERYAEVTTDISLNEQPELVIFNSLSQKVYAKKLSNRVTTLDLEGLQSGIYILQVRSSGKVYSRKVIINK